jgi:hypothetical protein
LQGKAQEIHTIFIWRLLNNLYPAVSKSLDDSRLL